ncbi:unnamed protein product [Echinostoma caproni]|uniref:CoA carboxyltransferase C-terminal domain-containing protein n=1 Tax=Echinostoma caproni TaxID=27848 RepID=A0A183ABP5_9TREM|nr:unnamed protein product [Echinostoma caproni]
MALNKLLGREVYTSNSQLGGVQVMANNGVSHLVASDELLALQQTLEWLSYVPARKGLPVPVLYRPVPVRRPAGWTDPNDYVVISAGSNPGSCASGGTKDSTEQLPFDPIDRLIDYAPSRDRPNDDPRWLFTGVLASQLNQSNDLPPKNASSTSSTPTARSFHGNYTPESQARAGDHWLSGFFDWGTWRETLTTWAAGVVVGRARLGGIPCGAITAETRSVTCRVPADPANLSTEAQVVNQAGQVWYPDSAYKTAQAIADFARERIPLFIFASWRGFSGGMKDMYDQVLKFGSMIIDALRRYPEPVFVYLPPQSQLRGGAWVVVDPAINPDRMEMYADPIACRAGVLEPEGTVEIKYRKPDLIQTMRRLDEQCLRLLTEIDQLQTGCPVPSNQINSDSTLSVKERVRQLQMALEARQKELRPYYHQVACTFADLHDTPGRLQTRGLVHGLVAWSESRSFFYARLRRRLLEMHAIRLMDTVCLNPANDVLMIGKELSEHLSRLSRVRCHGRVRTISELATVEELSQKAGNATADRTKPGKSYDTIAVPDCPLQLDPLFIWKNTNAVGPVIQRTTHQLKKSHEVYQKLIINVLLYFLCTSFPKGVEYSSQFARGLAILQQWFLQAHTSSELTRTTDTVNSSVHNTKTPGDHGINNTGSKKGRKSARSRSQRSTSSNLADENAKQPDSMTRTSSTMEPEAAERAWSDDHLGVGAWLAQQLGCKQFCYVPKLANLVPNVGKPNPESPGSLVDGLDEIAVSDPPEKSPVTFLGSQIEALKRRHMFERIQSTLSASSDMTKELASVLHQLLSPTDCAHLVQLLSVPKDHETG